MIFAHNSNVDTTAPLWVEESSARHRLMSSVDRDRIRALVRVELAFMPAHDGSQEHDDKLDRLFTWESGLEARAREAHRRGMKPGTVRFPSFGG